MIPHDERIARMHEAAGDYGLAAINRMTPAEQRTALIYLSWVPAFERAVNFIMEERLRKAERERAA